MHWVRLYDEGPCGQCGADMQRWVRVTRHARRIGEITFCPACSPQIPSWFVEQRNRPDPANN